MAAFDFPASPTDGQTYTPAGSSVTYTYSNAAKVWKAVPVYPSLTAGRVLLGDGTATPATDAELTYDATKNNLTVGGTVVMGSAYGFRNKIINGGMRIWQRGNGPFTSSGPDVYSLDRFLVGNNASITRETSDVPAGFTNATRCTVASVIGGVRQRIEASNSASLVGKNITISFWAKSISGDTAIQAEWYCAKATDNHSVAPTVGGSMGSATMTTAWQRHSITLSTLLPSDAAKGMEIRIFTLGTASQYLITGVQLEEGTVATPFEHRPIGLELQLCQRYYCQSTALKDVTNGGCAVMYVFKTLEAAGRTAFPVVMRAAPTITTYGNGGGTFHNTRTGTNITGGNPKFGSQMSFNGFDNLNSCNVGDILLMCWKAEAEL